MRNNVVMTDFIFFLFNVYFGIRLQCLCLLSGQFFNEESRDIDSFQEL